MKNEYKVTKQLMKSWVKSYSFRGAANIVNFIVSSVLGVVGILGLVFYIMIQDWLYVCMSVFLISLSVFRLFIARFVVVSRNYKFLSTTYGVTEWMRTIEFLDDEIIAKDHTSVNVFNYSIISEIEEKADSVILYMSNNAALILYKDAFVEGTWQECRALIFKNTGI